MASMSEPVLKRHRFALSALALTLIAAGAGRIVEWRTAAAVDARLWFFDVGKGSAALISDRDGRRLLVDAAPDAGVLEGLAEALPWWDRTIDVLLIARPDAEQEPVFLGMARRYRIREIWWTGAAPATEPWRRLVADVEGLGIPRRPVKAGDSFALSGGNDVQILAPSEGSQGRILRPSAAAALGIVGRLDCGSDDLLFGAASSLRPDARAGHRYSCAGGKLSLVR